jgi:hypothetical protein
MGAVKEWSAIMNAAQAACDMAATRVAECGPPPGSRDSADLISRLTGTSNHKAKDRIQIGQRLRQQEQTREAATSGRRSGDERREFGRWNLSGPHGGP